MGRLLTAIGVLIVVLLIALVAAPFFIDWTEQKPTIEREVTALIGLPIRIDGTVDVSLLPSPTIALGGVRLGAEGGEASVETLQLELSIGSLVKGEVHVTNVRLVNPKLTLAIGLDGRLQGRPPDTDLSAVGIERIDVEGGQVEIVDRRQNTRLVIDNLAFSGSAAALAGPWKAEGGARVDGMPFAFTLQTGRVEANGLHLKLGIEPVERPLGFDVEGEVMLAARPSLLATLKVRGIGAADAAQRNTGWRGETSIEVHPEGLTAKEIRLVPGNEDRVIALTGTADIAFGAHPRLDATLSTRQLDLDRLAGVSVEAPADVPQVVRKLAALPAVVALPEVSAHIGLDVGSVVLAGGLVQDLHVEADYRDERWKLLDADAKLPGQGTVHASADLGLRGGPLVFDGDVELAVKAPTAFSSWVSGELLRPAAFRAAPPPLGAVALSGHITATPERLTLANLTASVASATMTGELDIERAATPRLKLRLNAPDIDVEPLIALGSALAGRVGGLDGMAIDATLGAGHLAYRGLDFRVLNVALRTVDGAIVAERLNVGALNGVALTGTGRLAPDGQGTLTLHVEGSRLAPALDAVRNAIGAVPGLDVLRARAPALGPLALDVKLDTDGKGLDASVNGTANGTRIVGSARFDAKDLRLEALAQLTLGLDNPKLERLLAQLGAQALPAPGGRGGKITLGLERGTAGFHRLTLNADLGGTRLAVAGLVALATKTSARDGLAVALSSADVEPLLLALGTPIAAVDEHVPVSAKGRLAIDAGGVHLTALEASVAGETARGELTLGREAVPQLSGALDVSGIGVERVLALATGAWPRALPSEVWAGAPFGPRPVPAMTGTVSVKAARLAMGTLEVRQARFGLRVGETGLTIEGLSGQLGGGELTGEISANRTLAEVRLSGRLQLQGARLEELVWRSGERAVASGRLDVRLVFDGSGRSPAVLVGALGGDGTASLADGEMRGLAVSGFAAGTRAVEAGMVLDEPKLEELVRQEMDKGTLPYKRLDAAFAVASGTIRATNLVLDGAPLSATGRVALDLARSTLDADWALEAPSAKPGERGPRIGVLFRGPIEAPERKIDVRAFVDYLNVRRFEREVERLEAVQREIAEHERVMREIEQRERERRERILQDLDQSEQARRQRLGPSVTAPVVPPAIAPQAALPAPVAPPPQVPAAPVPSAPPAPMEAQRPPPPVTSAVTEPSEADSRARFNQLILDSLRNTAPAAQPPTPALQPLPPPVVIGPAPRVTPSPGHGQPFDLVPRLGR